MESPLKIAFVHYHMKRGGVTRVVESILDGFTKHTAESPKCIVIAGEIPDSFKYKDAAIEVKGLQYSNQQSETSHPTPEQLLAEVKAAARKALGGEPDLWHIHNHSLGKNRSMPGFVSLLAEEGAAMLLQMHDFSEDGRPENYLLNQEVTAYAQKLYPTNSNIHYAVLNKRDREYLLQSKIVPERLHILANPISSIENEKPVKIGKADILETLGASRLYLCPVRAVRRKNFGEILLWAAIANEGAAFATTLGPTNANYQDAYESWMAFARRHKLPIHFAISEQYDWSFHDIMGAADAILTTSIAEGFGLAFIEPWLFGKPIVGRDLPKITADFKDSGLDLTGLYTAIPIPCDWIDFKRLANLLITSLRRAYSAYGISMPANVVDRAIESISLRNSTIDFAGLEESLQMSVIERILSDPDAKRLLRKQLAPEMPSEKIITANAETIQRTYGLDPYISNLKTIYSQLVNCQKQALHYLPQETILRAFLKPESFRLLRT